jgi:hypothetical protein
MRDDEPDLGPCCMCETTEGVMNIIVLSRRSAIPGHGWGCFSCGLPADGAFAVLCDDCLGLWQQDESRLMIACRGYPATEGRIPIADLPPGKFDHDDSKHYNGILCSHVLGDSQCGFDITKNPGTTCNKTPQNCILLQGNLDRYGGIPR